MPKETTRKLIDNVFVPVFGSCHVLSGDCFPFLSPRCHLVGCTVVQDRCPTPVAMNAASGGGRGEEELSAEIKSRALWRAGLFSSCKGENAAAPK